MRGAAARRVVAERRVCSSKALARASQQHDNQPQPLPAQLMLIGEDGKRLGIMAAAAAQQQAQQAQLQMYCVNASSTPPIYRLISQAALQEKQDKERLEAERLLKELQLVRPPPRFWLWPRYKERQPNLFDMSGAPGLKSL